METVTVEVFHTFKNLRNKEDRQMKDSSQTYRLKKTEKNREDILNRINVIFLILKEQINKHQNTDA